MKRKREFEVISSTPIEKGDMSRLVAGSADTGPDTIAVDEFNRVMKESYGEKVPILVDTNPVSHIDNLLRKVYDNEL